MLSKIIHALAQWPKGIRFYIGLATAFVTLEIWWFISRVYGTASTAPIRLQETYAWVATGLILLALAIGPICKIFPRLPGKSLLRDARRLIGVSAAWFAALHIGITYFDQFAAINPLRLPAIYQFAFFLGLTAFIILLALTVTSFDAAFRKLGVWWLRLHRLIYGAFLLILVHAFAIGVHAATLPFIGALLVAVLLLFIAHGYLSFGPGREPTMLRSITIVYGLLLTAAVFTYGFTQRPSAIIDSADNPRGELYEQN